jgi:hypothetical protein
MWSYLEDAPNLSKRAMKTLHFSNSFELHRQNMMFPIVMLVIWNVFVSQGQIHWFWSTVNMIYINVVVSRSISMKSALIAIEEQWNSF